MTSPIALTGASGFIGRSLVQRLTEGGHSVRVLLRRPDAELEALGVDSLQGKSR